MYPEPEVEFDFGRVPVCPQFEVSQEGSSWRSIRHDGGTFVAVAGPSPRSQEFHPCKRAVVAGQSSAFNSGSSPIGEAHSPSEAQRRARDRGGGHREEDSGAHHVTTVDVRSPARHSTVPVRVGDEEWMREHRSRSARLDRVESAHHCDFHRRNKRVRFDIASGHVGWDEALLGDRHYRSCPCFMGIPQVICGKMQLARFTPFRRVKVENRAPQ